MKVSRKASPAKRRLAPSRRNPRRARGCKKRSARFELLGLRIFSIHPLARPSLYSRRRARVRCNLLKIPGKLNVSFVISYDFIRR